MVLRVKPTPTWIPTISLQTRRETHPCILYQMWATRGATAVPMDI